MPIKFLNDVAVDTSVLYVDTINNRVGIGTASPDTKLDVVGRAVIGTGNTLTNATNATVIGNSNNLTSDSIVDSNTNLVLVDYGAGRYANTIISDRTLRLGRADIISSSSFNTTGILNFNDSVEANSAFSNVGGFVGYFPPPTTTNNYNFFNAFSENVNGSAFATGASPTAFRMAISMDHNLDCVGYKFDSNTSAGGGVYYTASQNNANPSSRGIFTFDARHQNQNYAAPDGHALFEVTSGYGQTKFIIKQVSGSSNVGIGTTSPTQLLHVSGNARVTGAYYDSNNSPGTSNQVLVSTVTGTDWIDGSAIPGVPDGSGTAGKIVMWQDSDTLTDSKITQTAGSETNYVDVDFANVEDLTITGDSSFSTFTVNGFDAVNFTNIENNFSVGSGDLAIATNDNSMNLGGGAADSDTLTVGYTTTRFIGSGNVGIGTTSPAAKLEVEGGDHLLQVSTASATGNPYVSFNQAGTRRSFIQHSDSGDYLKLASEYGGISFFTGTGGSETQKMTILSGGNVGIGTTSPGEKLSVAPDTDVSAEIGKAHIGQVGFNDYAGFSHVDQNTQQGYALLQYSDGSTYMNANTGKNIRFRIGNSDKMILNSSGNVGIGTTSPSYKLDVNEDDNAVALRVTGGGGGAAMASFVRDVGATGSQVNINAQSNFPQIQFISTGNTFSVGGDTSGNFKISDNTSIGTNDRITIDNTGNVGIGTTAPAEKLAVSGSIRIPRTEEFYWTDGSVNGNPRAVIFSTDNEFGGDYNGIGFSIGANGRTAPSMYIRGTGNVGIGTTSPSAKLDVDGSFKLSDFTSTSVATTGSLSPNQNYQASTQDTLADLSVDPSGNVVRGMQEGTWTFTRAQLDGTLGMTLISAPGANKAVIVYESSWMIKYNATGSINTNQRYEIRQASNTGIGVVTILPGAKINEILSNGQTMPPGGASAYGFYSRDVPADAGGRTFKTNTATTLHKVISNFLPTGVETVSIKLRYRIYDATTF